MRTILRNICAEILAILSRNIIRKHQPIVVMITGSVGKTSTKDAVAAALSESFYLRKSEKSFNSDFGVPLTIIGAKNPWSNPIAWIKVFKDALGIIFLPTHYPELLVLEVGADRPGDLAKILKIAKPDAVVVTLLPSVPVHVEAYETPAAVREEEFSPVLALAPNAPLIISADDEFAIDKVKRIDMQAYCYGVADAADVRIRDVQIWTEEVQEGEKTVEVIAGMKAVFEMGQKKYPIKVRGALGRSQLFAPAAALATAVALEVKPLDALEGLAFYVPPPGRGRVFRGKKNSTLIDDTYNSSPAAVEEILRSLELVPANFQGTSKHRKVAVLGDMLELGRFSVAEHAHLGHIARETVDMVVTVGHRAKVIGETAHADGMPKNMIHHFETSLEAAAQMEELLEEGDMVVVKGSQGVRMERIVRPLLADFADVHDLARQDKEWLRR